jgi:hypothetical protein
MSFLTLFTQACGASRSLTVANISWAKDGATSMALGILNCLAAELRRVKQWLPRLPASGQTSLERLGATGTAG